MKVIKVIFGIICVVAIGIFVLRSMTWGPLKFDTNKVYIATVDGNNHILEFTDDYRMNLYRYGEEEARNPENQNQSITYYYGVETIYKYDAAFYNRILGPLHTAPDSVYRFAIYDESKEQRATMNLEVVDSKEMLVENYKGPIGKFKNINVKITEDSLSIGEVEYRIAEGKELLVAQTVMKDFEEFSK